MSKKKDKDCNTSGLSGPESNRDEKALYAPQNLNLTIR